MTNKLKTIEHFYVHIPFCAAKCNYCAFYSEASNASKMREYVEALLIELHQYAANVQPKTMFFGGGTPSLLPTSLMHKVLDAVSSELPLDSVEEWTIECNPSTVSTEKAKLFREYGVNRISMGVQALDEEMLDIIGRVHSVEGAVKSYEKLRVAGFNNINLDLMFGLPGQTLDQWQTTLEQAIQLQPEHLSTYCLILEEDTEFWHLFQEGHIKPNEELELAMYETAIDRLASAGYHQYETSNFAKPGRKCAHNIAYWRVNDFLGLGPSACSTVGSRRWQNVSDLERYITAMRNGESVIATEEQISDEKRHAEQAAFGMRMNEGLPTDFLSNRWDREITKLLQANLIEKHNTHLRPTRKGILFADEIATEFI